MFGKSLAWSCSFLCGYRPSEEFPDQRDHLVGLVFQGEVPGIELPDASVLQTQQGTALMTLSKNCQYCAGQFGADVEPTFLPVTLTTAPERKAAAIQAATPADTGASAVAL